MLASGIARARLPRCALLLRQEMPNPAAFYGSTVTYVICSGLRAMAHTSWMIERLNDETRIHHAEADDDFDLLFRDDAASTHYQYFLMRVYGFDAPLEAALSLTPNLALVLDLRERQKTGYLAQDLLALGLRPQELAEL